jgi:hypothetical protein
MTNHQLNAVLDQLGSDLRAAAQVRARRSLVRQRIALIGCLALLLAGLFTAPGRAVADWAAGLVGIGDEPTVPQHAANEADSIVIGVGEAPNGEAFEVVAFRLEASGEDDVCIGLDLSAEARMTGGVCVTPDSRQALNSDGVGAGFVGPAPEEFAPQTGLIVMGLTTLELDSVTVTYRDGGGEVKDAPVSYFRLTPELSRQIGSDDVVGAYYAFLPGDLLTDPNDGTHALTVLMGIDATAANQDGTKTASVVFDPKRELTVLQALQGAENGAR